MGDVVIDRENHAGPDQAVYIYGSADYEWWSTALGHPLEPGTFGENMTIANLESAKLNIGDRLLINDIILEVTAPRIPCRTLAARMGDPQFVKRFKLAERPGAYCRVISAGTVATGDEVSLRPCPADAYPLIELFRLFYEAHPTEVALRRALSAPVAIRARRDNEERLTKLLAEV
jgi:MOSC domain-containing protein YiiM